MKLIKTASNKHSLVISKKEWMALGKTKQWIKVSKDGDTIEIDGIMYEEKNGDLIPLQSKPEKPPLPKSVTIQTPHGNKIFTENSIEENSFGKYKILKINNDNIEVEYLTSKGPIVNVGDVKSYPAKSQAVAILSEERRKHNALRFEQIDFSNSKEYFTIGFLARHGRIRVEVPRHLKQKFDNMYSSFTGHNPEDFLDHGYAADLNPETKGNSWELRISFPTPEQNIIEQMSFVGYPPIRAGSKLEINYNNFVMNLFKLGFLIGSNSENVNSILQNVEPEHQEAFLAGFNITDRVEPEPTEPTEPTEP